MLAATALLNKQFVTVTPKLFTFGSDFSQDNVLLMSKDVIGKSYKKIVKCN